MASVVAEAAISSIFSTLAPKLLEFLQNQELCNFWGVRKKLKRLEEKLSRVQSVLNDAAQARIPPKPVEDWMDDLRGLAQDMDDILDEMNTERMQLEQAASKEASNSHLVRSFRKVFHNLKKSPHYVAFNTKLKSKINNVLIKLDEVTKDAHDLGLKELRAASSMPNQPRLRPEKTSFVDKSGVYGRLKEKEEIIELLLESGDSSQKKYSVIPIVGMGGIGKTTLAQLVFADKKVQDHFDWKSWACVSDVFDVPKVTKELIECVTKKDCSVTSLGGLQGHLEDMVRNKRCLFVLDDIWSVKQMWAELVAPFSCCANGSRILVTTRDSKIAKKISNKEAYLLGNLEDELCWDLFKEKALIGADPYTYAKLENIGKEIVGKCKGVPLAVEVLAGILQGETEEKWQSILRSELWQVDNDDEIFPALRISYYYLPSYLKCCFEYLSLFPTDHWLDKDELVRMWIAEDFVQGKEGRLPEDIASEYYDELKGRSLIQNDNRMHDLVHSLACLVSRKFYCRLPSNTISCKMGSIRHASFLNEPAKATDLDLLLQAKSLRTLQGTYHDKDSYALWERLSKWSLLRVFGIQRTDTAELPNCFGNLKHLRYLNLCEFGKIQNLPDSICDLYNLQTLDLRYCVRLNELPKDMGNLQRLRHLNLSYTSLPTLATSICKLGDLLILKLSGCGSLVEIPKDIGNLISLREIGLEYCKRLQQLPDSICKLHNLKVLNLIHCTSLCYLPEDIGDLQNIRELLLENTKISSLPESICKLHKLEVLDLGSCIRITHLPKDVGNLGSLKRLDLNETKLSLPDSILKISCLQELNNECTREDRQVNLPPHIGKLNNLESLEVYNVGKEMGRRIDELKDMNNMRGELVISHLENVESMEEALMADLKRKKHIKSLTLEWSPKVNESCESSLGARDIEAEVLEALEPHPTDLTSLSIKRYSGDGLPKWMFLLRFSSLQRLYMEGLERISKVVGLELPSLTTLEIRKCPNLRQVSMAVPKLEKLILEDCRELNTILPMRQLEVYDRQESINSSRLESVLKHDDGVLLSLEFLTIEGCPELNKSSSIFIPFGLRYLRVDYSYAQQQLLVAGGQVLLRNLTSLELLDICDLPSAASFVLDHHDAFPPSLRSLSIRRCSDLTCLPKALHNHLPSITDLRLIECPQLVSFPEGKEEVLPSTITDLTVSACPQLVSLREEGLPPALKSLDISDCPNLTSLPKHLYNLTSLITIDCPLLELRPDDRLPPNLQFLFIFGDCSKLEQQLQEEDRRDWLQKLTRF